MESVHATGTILVDAGSSVEFVAATMSVSTAFLGTDLGEGYKVLVFDRRGTGVNGPRPVGSDGEVAAVDLGEGRWFARLGVRILIRLILSWRIRTLGVKGIDITLAALTETRRGSQRMDVVAEVSRLRGGSSRGVRA